MAALCGILALGASAKDFDEIFNDSTLRLDYIFAGTSDSAGVFLERQSKSEGWVGRRHNLDKLPYTGNGIITIKDKATGDTIYRHSFSSLFSEWQRGDEAKEMQKAFQNTFLTPLPKNDADITIEILDNRHRTIATSTHRYRNGDILVEQKPKSKYPVRTIHQGGDPKDAIDVVILAEGYTADEMEKFFGHAGEVVEAMFSHEPFSSRRSDFNFIAVGAVSNDSGVSSPKVNDWRDTALGSNFSTFYSDRYLTTSNVGRIHDALTGIPYEHIIILANTPVYGGGGIYNSYTLTSSGNANFAPVTVHEFGHSFGGLADEYFYKHEVNESVYPTDTEPWEPNITTLVDFDSKWKPILKEGTPIPTQVSEKEKYPVGVFEGGGYTFKGVYRPADECRMRNNTYPSFCPACQRALNNLIDFYTKK